MNRKFEIKLRDLVSETCEKEGIDIAMLGLIDILSSLTAFGYIKNRLKSYNDFEIRLDNLLKNFKDVALEKYQTALEKEI